MHRFLPILIPGALLLAACGSSDDTTQETVTTDDAIETSDVVEADVPDETTVAPEVSDARAATDAAVETSDADSCEATAALFAAGPSVNADLADPESSATCDGDTITISSNGIPDYTYIQTSPGTPDASDLVFSIPSSPEAASEVTSVPLLGTVAVSLTGVPIYGPTEGTGGDVLSLEGALSECGSHNGPTGFHIHLLGTSDTTDCLFTPEEVAAEPQLVGYAFDGYPIYTGNDQYTSSWELTDESLFATDTWAAHSYVEGSGDLDECNGLTDADGNYAYYTTDTFPYVLGCYTGVVDLDASGAGGGGGGVGMADGPPGDGQGPPPAQG
ncbi:YHYH protein [Ilumatobacter sp.]|uniref:YHYH protein n=1 Tax=Ilumatobacter sp. TaxID=1967498 RepID=UPI003C421809